MLATDLSIHREQARDRDPILLGWPGPHFVVAGPGTRPDEGELRRLEESFRVVEFLDEPEGLARLVHILVELASGVADGPAGPFLYVRRALAPGEAASLAQAAHDDPWFVRLEQRDGRTGLAVLGSGIMAHSGLPELLFGFGGWSVSDAVFCDVVREMLGRPSHGRP